MKIIFLEKAQKRRMQKIVWLIVVAVLAMVVLTWFFFKDAPVRNIPGEKLVEVVQRWDLPSKLEEVSGIAYIGQNRIACVQDEEGIIFIYDLEQSQIVDQIKFGSNGDYEGIAVAGTTAYILRSDGVIFEVPNYATGQDKTIEHQTSISDKYDFEGIAYDGKNNRLLLAIKDKAGEDFKPVYAFDLLQKKISDNPAYKIFFKDPVFNILERDKDHSIIRPSEIGIHPVSGNIYVLEAVNPKLIIMDPSGEPMELHRFSQEQFSQAEGLTFGEKNQLYISNEGNNGPPNILELNLED